MNQHCVDPCPGACGLNAQCRVINHAANCICLNNFVGNPFVRCEARRIEVPTTAPPPTLPSTPPPKDTAIRNLCSPNPCGVNAACQNGVCSCLPEYHGDPYVGCRPECVSNSDCAFDKACRNQKCQDPCPGVCGSKAICNVFNHIAMCSCPPGMSGNALLYCINITSAPSTITTVRDEPKNPCQPSPCGQYAECRVLSTGQAHCSCLSDYYGQPPLCHPECISNSDCALNKFCLNQKCQDPCIGACGLHALCHAQNHAPICSCPPELSGNAFVSCQRIGRKLKDNLHYVLS